MSKFGNFDLIGSFRAVSENAVVTRLFCWFPKNKYRYTKFDPIDQMVPKNFEHKFELFERERERERERENIDEDNSAFYEMSNMIFWEPELRASQPILMWSLASISSAGI